MSGGAPARHKLLGACYTPPELARAMVELFCPDVSGRILEPACGDGVFIDAVAEAGAFRRGARMVAVDVDADAVHRAREGLPPGFSGRVVERDFLGFAASGPGRFDVIIGNPPYIRYHNLPAETRQLLADGMASHGMKPSRLANAWLGFVIACIDLLDDDGLMLFVLPAELMQVSYAAGLRRLIAECFREVTLVLFDTCVFDGLEQEVVVLAGRKGPAAARIKVINVAGAEDMSRIDLSAAPSSPLLPSDEKWLGYIVEPADRETISSAEAARRLVAFGELAETQVGVTTGNNSFFCLTEKTCEQHGLTNIRTPLLAKAIYAPGAVFTSADHCAAARRGRRAYLLTPPPSHPLSSSQRAYVEAGRLAGAGRSLKCSIRNCWYSVPAPWIPDAFLTSACAAFPRLIANQCRAVSTDNLHRVRLKEPMTPALALLAFYNSVCFASAELTGRSYGGGVLEITPGEARKLPVPDVRKAGVSASEANHLVGLVDSMLRDGESGIEDVLELVDAEILVKRLGFDTKVLAAYRNVWKTLQSRRLRRARR